MIRSSFCNWFTLVCLGALGTALVFPPSQQVVAQGDSRLSSDVNSLKNDLSRLQRDHTDLKREYESLKRDFDKLKRDLERDPKDVSRELARELARIDEKAEKAHSRIDGLKLKAGNPTKSAPWDCGKEEKEDPYNLRVMYGLRDGSGCKVQNINHYKELSLEIPRK
jgi:predicted RNase H-like nuclease (RuvC/YqgF family)